MPTLEGSILSHLNIFCRMPNATKCKSTFMFFELPDDMHKFCVANIKKGMPGIQTSI